MKLEFCCNNLYKALVSDSINLSILMTWYSCPYCKKDIISPMTTTYQRTLIKEKICQICGDSFTPTNSRQVICSRQVKPECRRNYNAKQNKVFYHKTKSINKPRQPATYKDKACKTCKTIYTPINGRQLYCNNCVAEAKIKRNRKASRTHYNKHTKKSPNICLVDGCTKAAASKEFPYCSAIHANEYIKTNYNQDGESIS